MKHTCLTQPTRMILAVLLLSVHAAFCATPTIIEHRSYPDDKNRSTSYSFDLTQLNILEQVGEGHIDCDRKGMEFTTTRAVCATFSLELPDSIRYATVAYSLSTPGRSVLSLSLDGQTIRSIQSVPESAPYAEDGFPLQNPPSSGKHTVKIYFASVDGKPVSVTVHKVVLDRITPLTHALTLP
jgi:hypothetical protein